MKKGNNDENTRLGSLETVEYPDVEKDVFFCGKTTTVMLMTKSSVVD